MMFLCRPNAYRTLSSRILGTALLLVCITGSYAQERRAGVLLPETAQMKSAVQEASRMVDPPLEEPDIEISIPLEDLQPAEIEDDSDEEALSEIEKTVAESLDPISLEERIQGQVLQSSLDQFGYDIFSMVPTTFAPVESIPVPPDYLVGPGDTFIIKIYGSIDLEYRLVVTREGKLLIPEIGETQVAGLTFDEAKLVLNDEVSSSRVGARAVVTLAELHTIQVLMLGEVSRPGAYTISGLSSLLNTLITTGGVKRSGTLRDIQVRRAGTVIASMDVYNLLLKGVDDGNIYLRQGDVVFVPPIGATVGVAGEVQRPAIYELKNETTAHDLISMAGGFMPRAAPAKSHIERIAESSAKTLISVDLSAGGETIPVQNGDLIRVFPVLNKMEGVVILEGHVLEPGGYQWFEGMRVSDLVRSRANLRQGVDYSIGLIQRESIDLKRFEALYFNLGDAMSNPGGDADLELQPRDEVQVFNVNRPRSPLVERTVNRMREQASAFEPPRIVELKGSFRHPGSYPLPSSIRLLDAVSIAGGITPGSDLDYALLVRKEIISGDIQFTHIKLRNAFDEPEGDHNPWLQPSDKVYVFDDSSNRETLIAADLNKLRKQTSYGQLSPIVTVAGSGQQSGVFPLTPGMRLGDLLAAAGGLREEGYGLTANLSRRELLNGQLTAIENIDVQLSGPAADGYDRNLILQPYDYLVLREKPEWIDKPRLVSIEGEVMYPGQYQVAKQETLCGLVRRAGGFTEDAYPFGSVFLRESVRKREQEALDKLYDELDDQLVDISLSPGYQKDQKLPVTKGSLDTYKVMRTLKRYKARGRLVVDVQRAVNDCKESADLVLEDGDRLIVPTFSDEVSVVGQVYFPSSHRYDKERGALDYVNLSGGAKEYAQHEHVYIVQANGEVLSTRSSLSTWGWALSPNNVAVSPGSTIYVPMSLDRINGREYAQSWIEMFYKIAIGAAGLSYVLD